jgi:hypothetical protein
MDEIGEHIQAIGNILFKRHLNETGYSYNEHFIRSITFAWMFIVAAIKAVIHAIIPSMFETSTTELLNTLRDKLIHINTL